ncbi:hypothetical protein AX14_013604 [Amanita brunnescens Koide BX004]|nr:hypothetical protein AX14_013604 [Amanita brunnescens Koide BX004]
MPTRLKLLGPPSLFPAVHLPFSPAIRGPGLRRSLSRSTALSRQALSRAAGSPSPSFQLVSPLPSLSHPAALSPSCPQPVTRSPLTRRVYTIGTTTLQSPTRHFTHHVDLTILVNEDTRGSA